MVPPEPSSLLRTGKGQPAAQRLLGGKEAARSVVAEDGGSWVGGLSPGICDPEPTRTSQTLASLGGCNWSLAGARLGSLCAHMLAQAVGAGD